MKNILLLSCTIFSLWGCDKSSMSQGHLVKDIDALQTAIAEADPGSEIVLANGVWKDVNIQFYGNGTEEDPITLRAETPGKVFIEGVSSLHLGGKYLVVNGLHFRNGHSPGKGVIRFQIGKDSTAFHSRVTECVVEDFNQLNRWERDAWVEFYGKHNQLDRCYLAGKSNDGVTVMVSQAGNKHTNNYHQIVYNYFGPRPRKGGPRGETMRIGGSETSMTPGRVNVSNNFFDACNGEVEIISSKTNYNQFTNNIFYKCEGSLVMRHGNYVTVDGNIFIGDDDSDFYGGIRAVNTGHWITNNYFYKIRGEEFRSPIAMMNGIPKSPLNRYNQVTDVVVAHNTWVDCRSPIQIGVGQNKASADVLPKSEIRSAPPIRTTIANNLIYNQAEDKSPLVNHDDMTGILFENNVIDNNGVNYTEYDELASASINMKQVNDWLFVPAEGQDDVLGKVYPGYDFEKIENDLFGSSRGDKNQIGAVSQLAAAESFQIERQNYGPEWFNAEKEVIVPKIISASSAEGELARAISEAADGDIIELSDKEYNIANSLKVTKEVTLRSKGETKVEISFSGKEGTPLFELNPTGVLRLSNLSLKGQNNQYAFAPLRKNMSSAYRLFVEDCVIENFEYILEASRGSFADSLVVSNSVIKDCKNGIILAAEEKGDYNAEMVTIENSKFENISQNVLHFYRGGYDESTIGGFLTFNENTVSNCGSDEESGLLLKTRGIINVFLTDNTFQNNSTKLVALLWGAKNNHHNNNTLVRSGEIKVEEQQKLELLY